MNQACCDKCYLTNSTQFFFCENQTESYEILRNFKKILKYKQSKVLNSVEFHDFPSIFGKQIFLIRWLASGMRPNSSKAINLQTLNSMSIDTITWNICYRFFCQCQNTNQIAWWNIPQNLLSLTAYKRNQCGFHTLNQLEFVPYTKVTALSNSLHVCIYIIQFFNTINT